MLILLLACSSAEEDAAGLAGTISLPDIDGEGTVAIQSAYGLAQDGQFIAYLSSVPDVGCEEMVTYLTPGSNTDDPSGIFSGDHCNLFMSLPDWSDGFSATDDPVALAGFSITCTLGDGAFVYEERDSGDEDYYWSGQHWQGHPDLYDLTITPSEGSYAMAMEMTGFSGTLIYEGFETYTGTGTVSGEQELTECADFSTLHDIY
ncbi:MAG: hypothetical protein ACI8RZ_000204 [Myxococcota bacterium]|jgi:hypothetical protein